MNKDKMIDEAIDGLQQFLESDMWSMFHPKHKFPATKNGKKVMITLYRKDVFKNEKDFLDYLEAHFNILRKEIKMARRRKK